MSFRKVSNYNDEKFKNTRIRQPHSLAVSSSPSPSFCHMPGSHLACSGEAAPYLSGTAAGRVPLPGHGRLPPPSGPPSGLSAPVPASLAAPRRVVFPLRPLPEVPGSPTSPREREGGSSGREDHVRIQSVY